MEINPLTPKESPLTLKGEILRRFLCILGYCYWGACILFFFGGWGACTPKTNPNIYYPDNVLEKIKPHQKIALMPFSFSITDANNGGEMNERNLEKHQNNESTLFQENLMLNYLDLETKNKNLTKNPIPKGILPEKKLISNPNFGYDFVYSDTLTEYSYKKLGNLLQVDALIVGKVQSYDDKYMGGRYGTEQKSKYNLDITYLLFDAKTGEKLWQLQLNNLFDVKIKQQSENLEQNFDLLNQKALSFLPYFVKK
jgi:hypothetical protein